MGTFLPLCSFCVRAADNLVKVGKCEHCYIHSTAKSSCHRERAEIVPGLQQLLKPCAELELDEICTLFCL